MNEFNSQVCTSVEQSKRLLAMGLKPETADMCHLCSTNDDIENPYTRMVVEDYIDIPLADNNEDVIPAWSLHRLMIIGNIGKSGFTNVDEAYNTCISLIASHIRFGLLNKEYFK